MSTESNRERLRMEALLAALAEDEPVSDRVGEGRRFLLDHLDTAVRDALDEPDPMLEEIKRHDEWLCREGKDVWGL